MCSVPGLLATIVGVLLEITVPNHALTSGAHRQKEQKMKNSKTTVKCGMCRRKMWTCSWTQRKHLYGKDNIR